MGLLVDLEEALITAVSAVQVSGEHFQTVRGFSTPRDRAVEAAIRRERKPAAYITYDGRWSDVQDNFFHGQILFSVSVAVDGFRGGDEPRVGSSSIIGAFDWMSAVTESLVNESVLTDFFITYRSEAVTGSDETFVMLRQGYILLGPGFSTTPLFGGAAVAGAESWVQVQPMTLEAQHVDYGFPGVRGAFRHHLGIGGRGICWTGRLVAADDDALNTVEAGLDALVASGEAATVDDGRGNVFADCVADSFLRVGPRRYALDAVRPMQDFELQFTQLTPGV